MANYDNYVIQGNTLDAIASEVKTLADTSDKISPNEMSEKLGQVNTDVSTQADLIAQIQTALEGKAAGGGGGAEEIEQIIDQSGVLDSTDGTATEKVEQLIDKAEDENLWYLASKNISLINNNSPFIGTKYSEKTLPRIDCSTQTNMVYAFSNNKNLEYVDWYINSSKCTNLASAFAYCSNLKRVKGIDTSSATNLSEVFYLCINLESIIEPLDVSKATSFNKTFNDCKKLKDIRFVPETIKVSIVFVSPVLSAESVQSIIDGLAPIETAQTLTLHKDVKAKLTEEQLATITNKNWNLA